MNRLFERFLISADDEQNRVVTSHWTSPVDIKKGLSRFVILADVSIVESKDVEITMEGGALAIKGERKPEKARRIQV